MENRASAIVTGFSGFTAGDIATYTGKSYNTSEQTLLSAMIKSVETFFIRNCNRNFAYGDENIYYEIFDGNITNFYTRNYPIEEIKSIYVDGVLVYDVESEDNTYVLNTDFIVYTDHITFNTISCKDKEVKVYYTIEKFWDEDMIEAIKEFVADMFGKRQYSGRGVRSFSFAGLSVTLA